jgi:hypothetical protein
VVRREQSTFRSALPRWHHSLQHGELVGQRQDFTFQRRWRPEQPERTEPEQPAMSTIDAKCTHFALSGQLGTAACRHLQGNLSCCTGSNRTRLPTAALLFCGGSKPRPRRITMQSLASLFILACTVMGPAQTTSILKPRAVSEIQVAQVPMGRRCVTPTGSCDTPRRPVNTLCYCGRQRGVVR